jgi:hypothetical protein
MKQVTDADHKASKVRAFLAAIEVCPSITRAAKAAGIQRGVHYRRYKEDPVYKAAFDEAWERGVQALEDDAAEKAMIGYEEPVVYQGALCYTPILKDGQVARGEDGKPLMKPLTIRRPNPSLLMFLLRGAKPEKFRERYEHTGKDGGPIESKLTIRFVKAGVPIEPATP